MGSPKYPNGGDPWTSGPGFGLTEHRETLDIPRPSGDWAHDLRQLDERPVPPRRSRRLHSGRFRDHRGDAAAPVSGADEAIEAPARPCDSARLAVEPVDGSERGVGPVHISDRAPS